MNSLARTVVGALALAVIFQSTSHAVVTARKLVASDGGVGDSFGISVATDGMTVIVGARDIGTPGKAYLFDATTGVEIAKLTPSDGFINQRFGGTVAVDGHLAIVGSTSGAYGIRLL